jgi:hypothetical protein
MFRLTLVEAEGIQRSRSQIVTLKRGQNIKYLPAAFTEHGAIMAANVLNSPRATQMSSAGLHALRDEHSRGTGQSVVRSCSRVRLLQNASWAWAGSYAGLRLKGSCSFLFAVLEVPKGTHAAMSLMERVVFLRRFTRVGQEGDFGDLPGNRKSVRPRYTTCSINRPRASTRYGVILGVSGLRCSRLQRLGSLTGSGTGMRIAPREVKTPERGRFVRMSYFHRTGGMQNEEQSPAAARRESSGDRPDVANRPAPDAHPAASLLAVTSEHSIPASRLSCG